MATRTSATTRHMLYFLTVMQSGSHAYVQSSRPINATIETLRTEWDNIWIAAQESYKLNQWDALIAFRDAVHACLNALGYWQEGLWLDAKACEAPEAVAVPLDIARWTHDMGDIFHSLGRYLEAEEKYKIGEKLYRACGQPDMAVRSAHMCSMVLLAQGRAKEASSLCERCITESQSLGLGNWVAHPLYVRGLLARDAGQFTKAAQCVEQSLALVKVADDKAMEAQCLHLLGEIALLRGNVESAINYLQDSCVISEVTGMQHRLSSSLRLLADIARDQGNFHDAQALYDRLLKMPWQSGDKVSLARIYLSMARLHNVLGQPGLALGQLQSATAIYDVLQDARGAAVTQVLLARQYLLLRKWRQAVTSLWQALKTARIAGFLSTNGAVTLLRRIGHL